MLTIVKCIAGKFGEMTSSIWRKKVWRNTSAKRLLIVSTNFDGFSLANHARLAKLSRYIVYRYNGASNSLETEDSLKLFLATCKLCPSCSGLHQ